VVVINSAVVFQLLAGPDKALNVRWDAQSVLDFVLDLRNGAVGFNSNSYGLTREALHKNLPGVIDLFQLLHVQLRQLLFGRCFPDLLARGIVSARDATPSLQSATLHLSQELEVSLRRHEGQLQTEVATKSAAAHRRRDARDECRGAESGRQGRGVITAGSKSGMKPKKIKKSNLGTPHPGTAGGLYCKAPLAVGFYIVQESGWTSLSWPNSETADSC